MITHPNVKLNLGLRVLGRREDGFHNIETLFVPYFGFADTLSIEPSREFSIEIDGPCYMGWDPTQDLCAKAWRLMHARYGMPEVEIRLTKTSPVGAGLGGGSADAAFTLLMLRDMFGMNIADKSLASIAAELGSDCAFFIYNTPMFATGRGEILEAYEIDLSPYRIEVQVPDNSHVSTKEAYAGLDGGDARMPSGMTEGAPSSPTPFGDLASALALPITEWREYLVNDFERSVFPAHPEIAALKEKMYEQGAIYASMSGSGSAVFGIFEA